MDLRKQIEQLRKQQDMSAYKLAKLANVALPHLRPILLGKNGCTLYTAQCLANALGYELKLVKKDEKI